MAYSTITDPEVAVGAPATNNLFTKLRDNPEGIATGASGATKIAEAALDSSIVSQGKLKSALQQNTASGVSGQQNIAFTGGAYTLGYGVAGSLVNQLQLVGYAATTYTWGIGIEYTGTFTYYFQARYIQASPPYDHGFGEIPLFIFLIIDKSGKIETIDIAEDAPWHYNGPTIVKPDYYNSDGVGYRSLLDVEIELMEQGQTIKQALKGKNRNKIIDRLKTDKKSDIEVTQDIKKADMGLLPHPFLDNDLTGKQVICINPQNPIVEELVILKNAGESIMDLFLDGDLIIGNTQVDRGMGVPTYDIKWR